ncbi:MAG: hypothetical protein OXO51_05180 [Gemmatimonadota bacterium]|nr:hypothetical protein [Gemmatimonadota bacterium]
MGVVIDVTTASPAARPGQGHAFQGHRGKALFVNEVHVGHQAAFIGGFSQPRIGNQDFIAFRKSLQHNGFYADRQIRAVIRHEQQKDLQTRIQDTGVQAIGPVAFIPGCQRGQGFPVGVHDIVDLAEGGPVLKPQFGGAFVESVIRDPAIASGFDAFQVDVFGNLGYPSCPGHTGSFSSHVCQPARSRFL